MSPCLYLDCHAKAPMDPRVIAVMCDAMGRLAGNAASDHGAGREARAAVEAARADVAALASAAPEDVVFVSGATEGNNLAIRGVLGAHRAARDGKAHVVTSAFEHASVRETLAQLARRGLCTVTEVPVYAEGVVRPEDVERALRPDTALVTVMAAQNEVGTVQPVDAIAELCRRRRVIYHCDAAQGFGRMPLGAPDIVTASAQKLYGPTGSGCAVMRGWVRRWVEPLMYGGSQEDGVRPGTLNTYGSIGFGAAARLMAAEGARDAAHQSSLRNALWDALLAGLGPDAVRLNGAASPRLPGNLSVLFPGVCPSLLIESIGDRVAVSSAAACRATGRRNSHVLRAMGVEDDGAVLRFGVGRHTTAAEVQAAARIVVEAARALRGAACPVDPAARAA